jgi:hypothetical protein
MGKKDNQISDSAKREIEKWAFKRAAEKDAKDGLNRVNFMLDQKNDAKKKK